MPLDTFGRNLYLDTLDSALRGGLAAREQLPRRNPTGAFCYGFFPHGSRRPGGASATAITVIGPGVTPDVRWEGAGLPDYDPANAQHVQHEQEANTHPRRDRRRDPALPAVTIVVVCAVWVVAALVFALALGPVLGASTASRRVEREAERRERELARSV